MVLVVGATGLLGSKITRKLLEEGQDVRILVRHESPAEEMAKLGLGMPAQPMIEAGAIAVYGDLKDRDSLDAACQGIDTVITTANSVLRGGDDTIEAVDLKGTTDLIAAAGEAGVKQFIYTSAMGAQVGNPNPLTHAKGVCEAELKQSEMAYTILKPGVFLDVWVGAVVGAPLSAGQPVTLVGEGKNRNAFVAADDVAAYAVAAVDHAAAQDAEIEIGGPQAYSWNDIVSAASEVLGMPLAVNYVAIGEPVPLLPEAMLPILYWFESSESYLDMTENSAVYGITPTSLESFLAGFFQDIAATA